MKAIILFLLAGAGLLSGQDQRVLGKSDEVSLEGKILRIEVGENDLVNGQSFKFWERILDRAKEEGAKGVIFDLDTPGGLAFPTKELMSQIAELGIPTVSFVNPDAISAGSFIAISTDRIYMKPGGLIGSSGLVSGSGAEIDPVMRAKLESYFGAHIRYIAGKKGRNPKVIEAMMFLSDEDRQIGDVTVKAGALLNLNSVDATKILDDGPLLAEAEVDDLEEILKIEGWEQEEVVTAKPTGFELLAWWIANYSYILIIIGLVGGYLEIKTPGFGLGGIVSLSAFAIFFFGNYVAGNMAGYELVALFVLGIILIGVEIFVIPGFGVAGITGLGMVLGALIFSMLDGAEWQTYQWGGSDGGDLFEAFERPMMNLAIGIFGSLGLLFVLMKYLPQLKFVESAMLPGALARGNGSGDRSGAAALVGLTGAAKTDLRPSGKAEIDGKVLEVLAEGEFVRQGDRIRVVSEDGMGIVVKKIES